jgi:2-polyprenyl-3-methyl-5-hydroxy-6-metoxy-1,4-benzoquinol methylase
MSSFSGNPGERFVSHDRFQQAYQSGDLPWDTNISPPELVEVVEGLRALPAGRALDLGCGTGTNSLYLARHGWKVTGIDFVAAAIERAREKQSHAIHLLPTPSIF